MVFFASVVEITSCVDSKELFFEMEVNSAHGGIFRFTLNIVTLFISILKSNC